MGRLLDACYLIAYLLALPWIVYRHYAAGGWQAIGQRIGAELGEPTADSIWLHASSVGEVTLLKPLVESLAKAFPDTPLVISAYTPTGIETARRIYPEHRIVAFPFDFRWIVRRYLRRLRPRLVVIAESELWPNFMNCVHRDGIPIAIVNGKMSEKSYRLHARTRFVSRALRRVRLVAVQSDEHAERMTLLGADPNAVVVTGNMKYDAVADDDDLLGARDSLRARYAYDPQVVLIIGASLHADEDAVLLAAFERLATERDDLALVLVPRYPDQVATVAEHVRTVGRRAVLKTQLDVPGVEPPGKAAVLIVDTLGELASFYAIADVAFVGGSLFHRGSNKGGHNLMEPAVLGLPVLFGPYNFSFRETANALQDSLGGIEVGDEDQLVSALGKLVTDADSRRAAGMRARQVIAERRGASATTIDLLFGVLGRPERELAGQQH